MNRIWKTLVCAGLLFGRPAAPGAEPPIDFSHQIVPVLRQHCGACHLKDNRKGGFSMNTRADLLAGSQNGEVLTPGKNAGASRFVEVLRTEDKEIRMPPKGDRVPPEQIALLARWIDAGVPWQEGFAFGTGGWEPPLAPRKVALPPPVGGCSHPIDRLLDRYWQERGIRPPGGVSDAVFLRRLFLDTIGLLPTPEELDAFLRDPAPDKRERWIDRVLARDIDYAEHWLSFWNDLLRNDYAGTGFIDGGRKQITAWLYASLTENKPFDRFVRELIAPAPESEGFIRGIQWRGRVNASQTREIQFAENLSQVFLGINMKCASCHDSFIDRWKLEDAYGLAAVYAAEPIEIHRCDMGTGRMATPGWIFPELGNVDAGAPPAERLRQLAALMTHPENGRFTRTLANRLWHRMMGRGIAHPVDAMHTEPWHEPLLDWLATDFAENGYDLRQALRRIATSAAYQSQMAATPGENAAGGYVFQGPLARRMSAEQFLDAVWQLTGASPAGPDAPVAPPGAFGEGRMVRASLMKSDLLMRSLGRPNREQVVTVRPEQLSTLQAIDLSNGEILAGILRQGVTHLLTERPSKDAGEWIDWLFRFALSREPEEAERAVLLEMAGGGAPSSRAVEDILWSLVMLPEFQLIR